MKVGKIPDSFLITPNTSPNNLSDILAEKDFNIDASGLCMAMDLIDMNVFQHQLDSIKVIEVRDIKTLGKYY